MTEIQNKAIEKINGEMQKRPNDLHYEIVGHYLIDRSSADALVAAKVAEDGKSLEKAWAQVTAMAEKKQRGNVGVLSPSEVFGAIDKYFGLTANVVAMMGAMASVTGEAAPAAEAKLARAKKALDLSDFF